MSNEFLPFHEPEIGPEEIRSVVETLESGWLTSGSKVKRFEEDFSRFIGCQYSVAREFLYRGASSRVGGCGG